MKNILLVSLVVATAGMLMAGCSKIIIDDRGNQEEQVSVKAITAYYEDVDQTRACITSEFDGFDRVAVMWNPGDALGVFTDSGDKNVKYTNTQRADNVEIATFTTNTSVSGVPTYGYYPYDAANSQCDASAINGNVPQIQTMNLVTGMIPGDFKIGVCQRYTSSTAQFAFTHLFSPIRIQVDGVGTSLSNDRLVSIELTVTRNGTAVPVCGDFTLNAVNGTYTLAKNVSNSVTFDWTALSEMDVKATAYATLFPEIREGDKLSFTIKTSTKEARLEVTAKVDFQSNHIYTFPLKLSEYTMTVSNRSDITSSGSFTVATYNVDGLPNLINSDGPGSSGTSDIGQKIASSNWDIIGFSEDFEYHTQLASSLQQKYQLGTNRGTVDLSNALFTADTDGLGFACYKTVCSFVNEGWTKYDSSEGGITDGANTCIKKGYRYYLVTLKDGTKIDFVITHMNTYGNDGRFDAQNAQLTQLAKFINTTINANKRPLIFMGDTNCRYTRNNFQKFFWKYISGVTYSDPWVDYYWDGIYPTFGTSSIMPADAPDPSADELPLYSNQKGEVVDKIIFFNHPSSDVQIRAVSYERDEDFAGIADHMPVVAEFYYEK